MGFTGFKIGFTISIAIATLLILIAYLFISFNKTNYSTRIAYVFYIAGIVSFIAGLIICGYIYS